MKIKNSVGILFTLLSGVLLFFASCKKGQVTPPQKTDQGKALTTSVNLQVAAIDSLSSFAPYLQSIQLSDSDAVEGITIFAPVNSAFARKSARLASPDGEDLRKRLPDSSDVEDYIVRGIIKYSDLTNGKKLTTLSGITLTITVDNGVVKVNGVVITNRGITDSSKTIIYTIAGLFQKSPSLTVTVMDGAAWVPNNPQGVPAVGATVSLFSSRQDYAAGKSPVYTATTDVNGEAVFKKVDTGTYYIVAQKEDESNILKAPGYFSGHPENADNVYYGLAISDVFHSKEEISSAPQELYAGINGLVYAALGNFNYKDLNGDGVIDQHDFTPLPYESMEASQGQHSADSVLIGYPDNLLMKHYQSIADADSALSFIYFTNSFSFFTTAMIDGYLSGDAVASTDAWNSLNNFTFTASTPLFSSIWTDAYQLNIPILNRIIADVRGLSGSPSEKVAILAQAKVLQAAYYLRLVSYFGDVPVLKGVLFTPDIPSSHQADIYQGIVDNLDTAMAILPTNWDAQNSFRPTKWAAEALLAKAYFLKYLSNGSPNDLGHAAMAAEDVIDGGGFQLLQGPDDVFKTTGNQEDIWNIFKEAADMDQEFQGYFGRGNYCPVLRLPEMYLIAAAGMIRGLIGGNPGTYINPLYARRGLPAGITAGMTASQELDALHSIWHQEMYREGNIYMLWNHWGTASQELGAKGYRPFNALLPIPQNFIGYDAPFLRQNPGY